MEVSELSAVLVAGELGNASPPSISKSASELSYY